MPSYEPFWYADTCLRDYYAFTFETSLAPTLSWEEAEYTLYLACTLWTQYGTMKGMRVPWNKSFLGLLRHDLWSVYLYPRVNREI
jgi:hypothetical protein